MNEEYKHLAIEATRWCEANAQGTPIAWEWEAKFAELIIKQCVQICDNNIDDNFSSAICARNEIKEHFGVK